MVDRKTLDRTYMEIAEKIALLSRDEKLKVGAILVKNNSIIAEGFNGTPTGFHNDTRDDNGNTKPEVLHAESNAIAKIAKSHNSTSGATLYTTLSPCRECAKLIIQCEIERVVFKEIYTNGEGIWLMRRSGIQYERLS